jgi:hypothetical protein
MCQVFEIFFLSSLLYSQIVVHVSCMLNVYRMLLNFIEIQGQIMSPHRFNSFNKCSRLFVYI